MTKRFFDILFSLLLIILFFPFFLLIFFLLKFSGEGEIFFFQERIGINRKKFNLIKFATMLKNSPKIGSKTITLKNDPRVLPLGLILRKTKINELPQLFNIFKGDMSFIGPRPLTNETFLVYDLQTQKKISSIKPGLSGIGSIIFRNEEYILSDKKNNIKFIYKKISKYKGKVESWYVENDNFLIYIKLIIITAMVVIFPKTKIIWRVFKDLPKPPKDIKSFLN